MGLFRSRSDRQSDRQAVGVDLLLWVMGIVLSRLSDDVLVKTADTVIDLIENLVKSSPTEVDDQIVLPVLGRIREAFGIPDNDAPPVEV